jgi:hypothetical protein
METHFNLYYGPRSQSDDLTRGGPMMQTPSVYGGSVTLNSNFSKPNYWRLGTELSSNEIGGQQRGTGRKRWIQALLEIRVLPRPQWFRLIDKRQYVTTLDGGLDATYGNRYVFATADQSVLAMTVRLNYTIKPDVTLELFAQPFTASGDYSAYGEQSSRGSPAPRVWHGRHHDHRGGRSVLPGR